MTAVAVTGFDAREALGTTLNAVGEQAAHRKVIVWEFVMRNLAVGGWQLMP
jgi:hypothetical protein